MRAFRAVVLAPLVLVVLVLVNGGFVYKTTCPEPNGHTQTSWQYRIFDVLPYVGYSSKGCTSHTATRELLSAVGIWNLSSTAPTANAEAHSALTQLATLKNRMDSLDQRENAVKPVRPYTKASLRAYGLELQPYAERYVSLASDIRVAHASRGRIADPNIAKAWNLIQRRASFNSRALTRIASDLQRDELARFATEVRGDERIIAQLDTELRATLTRLNAKYSSSG